MQRGEKYGCPIHGSVIIVTKVGGEPLLCNGIEFEMFSGQMPAPNQDPDLALSIGRRHRDEESDLEVLCIRAGDCALNVGGRPTQELAPKVLPSAD